MKYYGKRFELGPLELKIMQLMWENKSSTVGQIHAILLEEKERNITTISTTMNRLFKKGLLSREITLGKTGPIYKYEIKKTEKGFREKLSKNLADQIIKSYGHTASMKIVQEISKNFNEKEFDDLLLELEKLKQQKSDESNSD